MIGRKNRFTVFHAEYSFLDTIYAGLLLASCCCRVARKSLPKLISCDWWLCAVGSCADVLQILRLLFGAPASELVVVRTVATEVVVDNLASWSTAGDVGGRRCSIVQPGKFRSVPCAHCCIRRRPGRSRDDVPLFTQERFAAAHAAAAAAAAAAIARETAMEDPDDNVPLFTKDSFAYSSWRS